MVVELKTCKPKYVVFFIIFHFSKHKTWTWYLVASPMFSNFIAIKLNTTNFLLLWNQIILIVHGLDVLHHLLNKKNPIDEIKDEERNKRPNMQYQLWINNDRLLTSWPLGNIKEDILSIIFYVETTYEVWTFLEEKLLPVTVKKKGI